MCVVGLVFWNGYMKDVIVFRIVFDLNCFLVGFCDFLIDSEVEIDIVLFLFC